MNLDINEANSLVTDVLSKLDIQSKTEVVFTPSFIYLHQIAKLCKNRRNVYVAAQDCSVNIAGAYTGEVSANMLSSVGVKYVIIGHSERRINFKENNKLLKFKVARALSSNLNVIFCCGENEQQRKAGVHFDWIKAQINESLFSLSDVDFSKIIIAYEPIWAIGTGNTATSEQAQEIHNFIRHTIKEKYGFEIASNTSILYGGSCNSSNSIDLFNKKDIDGGLIGGASLNSDNFIDIINSF